MELAASLPRKIGSKDHRYQYISRLLGNAKINCDEVMAVYAGEIFARLAAQGQTIVVMLDQSKVNDFNEVLMVSVRIAKRALPVAWRVRRTRGNIGFVTQEELLNEVRGWLPADVGVMLAADRFYGTAKLIGWCQDAGWGYRIRLKGNLSLGHEGGEMTTGEALSLMPGGLEGAELYGSGVVTNIGLLHEKGHPEPWIIAMDARPGKYTTLDYGLRWGIEPMFSDFKSRGFGLTQSHIEKPERVEAAHPGYGDRHVLGRLLRCRRKLQSLRERRKRGIRKRLRSLCSLFKQGLRFLRRCIAGFGKIPRLWEAWAN